MNNASLATSGTKAGRVGLIMAVLYAICESFELDATTQGVVITLGGMGIEFVRNQVKQRWGSNLPAFVQKLLLVLLCFGCAVGSIGCITTTDPATGAVTTEIDWSQVDDALALMEDAYDLLVDKGVISPQTATEAENDDLRAELLNIALTRLRAGLSTDAESVAGAWKSGASESVNTDTGLK